MILTGALPVLTANLEYGDNMAFSESEFQRRVLAEFKELNKRLFQDNGNTCVQSKVNKNSLYIKWMAGVFSFAGVSLFSLLLFLIKQQLGG